MPTLVTSGLEPYFASVAEHASGTIENDVLEQIEHLVGGAAGRPLAEVVRPRREL